MSEILTYLVDEKEYPVEITRKWMKSIQYRFKDGKFLISAPRLVSKASIIKGLDKFARKLIARDSKEKAITDGYIYIFGEKHPTNNINIDNNVFDFSNEEIRIKELKKLLLKYIENRVGYFSNEMNIDATEYKIKIRDTKTRLGSNSRRTKTLAFALSLIHFSKDAIDSVVIHELAHCKVFNHSKDFYNVVYQHCPNYNVLRKKLIHSEFK